MSPVEGILLAFIAVVGVFAGFAVVHEWRSRRR